MFGFLYRSTIGTWLNVCSGRKPMGSLLKNWKAACLLPFVHLGVAKDFWSGFDRYLEMETGHGSTFFVIPRGNYPGRRLMGPPPQCAPAATTSENCFPNSRGSLRRTVRWECMAWTRGWTQMKAARSGRACLRQLAQPNSECECTGYFLTGTRPALLDDARIFLRFDRRLPGNSGLSSGNHSGLQTSGSKESAGVAPARHGHRALLSKLLESSREGGQTPGVLG